jgi:hypothetical protein
MERLDNRLTIVLLSIDSPGLPVLRHYLCPAQPTVQSLKSATGHRSSIGTSGGCFEPICANAHAGPIISPYLDTIANPHSGTKQDSNRYAYPDPHQNVDRHPHPNTHQDPYPYHSAPAPTTHLDAHTLSFHRFISLRQE